MMKSVHEKLRLASLARQPTILEAIRLFNGLGDGIEGLTIDQFKHHYQIQLFKPQTEDIIQTCVSFLKELNAEFICLKTRVSASGASLQKPDISILFQVEGSSSLTKVREGFVCVEVDLLDTINPGLFLDMRHFRLKQSELILDQLTESFDEIKLLNLFSYTCSFGLHSAMAGAQYTCNVDISGKILDRGKRNYQLSGIDPNLHGFVREDTRKFLEFCIRKEKQFDFIVLDPPTFARYKKKTWSVHKELAGLLEQIDQILKPGGRLLLSTNASDIANSDLKTWAKPFNWKCIEEGGQDLDFKLSQDVKVRESSLSVCWFRKNKWST